MHEQSRDRTAYHRALRGGVAPRLIVTREDTKMASAHELLVVHAEDRVVTVEEVRVEDDFDAVARGIEQLHSPDLIQDRVVAVVRHVVRRDGWESVSLEREDASLEKHLVFLRQQIIGRRKDAMFA